MLSLSSAVGGEALSELIASEGRVCESKRQSRLK